MALKSATMDVIVVNTSNNSIKCNGKSMTKFDIEWWANKHCSRHVGLSNLKKSEVIRMFVNYYNHGMFHSIKGWSNDFEITII